MQQGLQKNRPVQAVLRCAVFVLFAVLFGVLFANVLFNNMHYTHYSPVAVLACAAAWFLLAYGLYWLTDRYNGFLQSHEKLLLAAFLLLEVATMLFFYWQAGAYPTRDFERVFTGAVNYAVNGYIEEPYLTYFYRYPNNMPLTIVLELIYRAFHKFGLDGFLLTGALFNAGCMLLGYLFVYLCCRRLLGVGKGFLGLGLLYLCLPLQCYISIFYTDTTTLWFAPFIVYMYLRLRDAATWKGRLAALAILCPVAAVGVSLKYSVAITLIAVAVDMLLRLDWKRLGSLALGFGLCFAASTAFFNYNMYAGFLDKETARDMATPFTAWIMMGLAGDGSHNPEDNYYVWNYETEEEMQDAAMRGLRARLGAFTPVTFLQFMNQKGVKSFGSGNLDYINTVADAPMRQTFLVECVSSNGRYFTVFDTVVQGYHVMLFLSLIAGAALAAHKKNYTFFVPYLAVLGLYLFLLLWESGGRYLINYYGMYIVSAVGAFSLLPVIQCKKHRAGGQP